jgi:hypothetical protein
VKIESLFRIVHLNVIHSVEQAEELVKTVNEKEFEKKIANNNMLMLLEY